MKIKEVCKRTNLTERTIRYYVERQLVIPKSEIINGRNYQYYSEENITQLLIIAELRKLEFGIDDIIEIQDFPHEIRNVLLRHHHELSQRVTKKNDIIKAIENIQSDEISSAAQLVEKLSNVSIHYPLPSFDIQPNFSKFDSETKEEKESAYLDFLVAQRIRNKISRYTSPLLKGIVVLIGLAALFGIVVAISGIPRTINKEYPAVQYRINDETYSENTTIAIKGKLFKRLFSEPKFVGSFVVDNFEYTKTYELANIMFYKSIRNGWGGLTYITVKDGRPIHESLGSIWMSDNFEKLTIWVYEPLDSDHKSTTDLVISAPAKSRSEAIGISKQLNHDIVWE